MEELKQFEKLRAIQGELEEEIERLLEDRFTNREKLESIHGDLECALEDIKDLWKYLTVGLEGE